MNRLAITLGLLSLFLITLPGCTTSGSGGGGRAPSGQRQAKKTISRQVMFARGLEAFQSVTNRMTVITGTAEAKQVEVIGKRIRQAAMDMYREKGQPNHFDGFDWRYVLVDDPRTKNAFVLPGGRVVVFSGILPVTQDVDGLAALMGHEVAHAVLEHANERLSRRYEVTGLFSGKAHSRLQEKEADEVGMLLMARAGYDPAACKALWRRMNDSRGGQEISYILSTHPADAQRIHNLGRLEASVRPLYEQSVRAGYAFNDFEPEFAALDHFAGMAKGHNGGFTQLLTSIDFIERYKRNNDAAIGSAIEVLKRDLRNRTVALPGGQAPSLPRAALDFANDNASGKAVATWLEGRHVKAWNFPEMRKQIKQREVALQALAATP